MLILLTMLATGIVMGFIGAGGSGSIIAILTIFFGINIHAALGTSLLAMVFTSIAGGYSHFREHNIVLRTGLAVGGFGAGGAFLGSRLAGLIHAGNLKWLTGSMLIISSIMLAIRIFKLFNLFKEKPAACMSLHSKRFWLSAAGLGIITGLMSGLFGIGAAPFIQIGLLLFFGLTIQQSVGTTLLIILPIALVGGLGYFTLGFLDLRLFFQVVSGTIIGSYIGAKFTNRLPDIILKIGMIIVPVLGGLLLLFFGK